MSGESFAFDVCNDEQENEFDNERILISIFFDGTCNNRTNVNAREKYKKNEAHFKDEKELSEEEQAYISNQKENSYKGDHTNVDKIEDLLEVDKPEMHKLYIEGIATKDLEGDDLEGSALGMGETGVLEKVEEACKRITSFFDINVTYVTFDVYGFSRGAAAARNFVYEVMREEGFMLQDDSNNNNRPVVTQTGYIPNYTSRLLRERGFYVKDKNLPSKGLLGYFLRKNKKNSIEKINNLKIKIRFIGLFDTVASYTLLQKRNVKLLNLNKISDYTDNIVHLIANDEHRKNFALTPVKGGVEITLPGSHSDIGGGYIDNDKEDCILLKRKIELHEKIIGPTNLEKEMNRLMDEGWFRKEQLKIKLNLWHGEFLRGTRQSLRNSYSNIPLQIMIENWQQIFEKKMKLRDSPILVFEESDIYINDVRQKVKSKLLKLVLSKENDKTNLEEKELSAIIKEYFDNPELRGQTSKDAFLNELLYFIKQKIKEGSSLETYPVWKAIAYSGIVPSNTDSLKSKIDELTEMIVEQMLYRILRNECLHWSAHYEVPDVHAPNIENGKRRRLIYHG